MLGEEWYFSERYFHSPDYTKVNLTNPDVISQGISISCVAGKILYTMVLNRLNPYLLGCTLPQSQCGVKKNRGTLDKPKIE